MNPKVKWWRNILAADIVMHLIAIWWFAYLPPDTLNGFELLIMAATTFAAVGVVAHAFRLLRLPGEQWAYLLSGFICLFTVLAYEVDTLDSDVALAIRIPFGLFLFAGAVSSFAAHVIDGGTRVGEVGRGK